MSKSKNDLDFINELVADLEPRKVLLPAEKRLGIIVVSQFIIVTMGMLLIQSFRPGFLESFKNLVFATEFILGTVAVITALYFALLYIVPGAAQKKTFWIGPIVFLITASLIGLGLSHPHPDQMMLGKRPMCVLEVLIFGILPFIHMLYLVKKGFLADSLRTFVAIGLGSALIPAILMHIACMYEPIHVLKYHLAPVIVFVVITTPLAIKFVRNTK